MKKTYSNPVMEVVKVQTMQMLAASETLGSKGSYTSGGGITLGGREDDGDWDEE